ncbi:uroporphyrinogen-III synthase [Novosphingobium hassiacum]|uniref:Uroporphyrinogen-III synthase n=1 Tax=Novosphingobium hassiacum TaxID=173676 RepID=A0A7W5ZY98_9SPHN|nr:uroporphyrinogen-III synthase [Novosphingobium hassiacum]MBB3861731.1 uroporphyrinogen-III synthase [Novosphingobium hassiacum]
MTAPLPLVVIRPEPGNAATLAAARNRGLSAHRYPMFDVVPIAWKAPSGCFAAILAGSANVFRHGGPQLDELRPIPVIAVGATTAEAARNAGFTVKQTGEGGLQPLVATLAPGEYLRLAGQDHVHLSPPAGVRISTQIVYAALARPVAPALATLLTEPAVVLLHSGEAARHFRAECERIEVSKENIYLACLAPRIAEHAGAGWAGVCVSASRTDTDLLELAATMCDRV